MAQSTRRAILIHSQCPNGSILPGIINDTAGFKSFLKSPCGGAFIESEIIVLNNPTKNKVLNTVRHLVADYLLVYFSGHGFTSKSQERMICLTDGNLSDVNLLNESPKQLVIIDACRTLEKGVTIGSIKWPEEQWDNCTGYSEARAWFDECIIMSPSGKMIVHSTADNKPAYENLDRKGGQFTLALLDSIHHFQQSNYNGVIHVKNMIEYVRSVLQKREVDQLPGIFVDGNLLVPIALVSPNFIYVNDGHSSEQTDSNRSPQNVMAFSLLLLVTLALANKL